MLKGRLLAWNAVLLLVGIGSCGIENKIKRLEGENQKRISTEHDLQQQINFLRSEHEKALIAQNCKNLRVLKFLQDCKEFLKNGESSQCNKLNVEQAMRFMQEESHVVIRLRPNEGLEGMTKNRRSQLGRLLEPGRFKSISSVLIITQPQSDKPEHGNEALHLGRMLKRYLSEKHQISDHALLGPLSITCRGKAQMLDQYANQIVDDKPDFEEPQGRAPKIAAWVFRLDCGNVAATAMDSPERSPTVGQHPAHPAP